MKHWFILGKICMKGQEMLILFFWGEDSESWVCVFIGLKIFFFPFKIGILCLILGGVLV